LDVGLPIGSRCHAGVTTSARRPGLHWYTLGTFALVDGRPELLWHNEKRGNGD
jgi:hypothetical protein